MKREDAEESRLRSVALQTANSIQHARQRAEEELFRAKEALEQKTNELAHSLAMVRATLESTTDAILATDDSRKVTNRNHQYLAMWRIPPESKDEQDHRQLLKIVARQFSDPSKFIARVEEIHASSPPESYDLLELADGRVIERFARIQFVDERNVGRVWTFRDITERRRAEEARLHLAAVVDSSDDAIVSKDLNGVVRSWNRAASRIFGYAPEEVIGKPITLLLPAERLHEEKEILQRLQRGEHVDHFETVRVHKNGWLIDVSVTISPVRDSSGHIVGASKIARDISDRKRGERITRFLADASAALAELTDYESTLQKVASLAVPYFADWCAVDMLEEDGSVRRIAVRYSDATKEQLANDLERRYLANAFNPCGTTMVLRTGEPDWIADIPEALLMDGAQDEEHRRLLRELALKSFVCVPLCSRTRTLGALTFVTAESGRSYEADDLRTAEDLAHRAVIAIENAHLLSMLKKADHHKDEFLATLAHELRNPLAPIRNGLQLLRLADERSPIVEQARAMMERQLTQLVRLVDDLLDVSRVRTGKLEIHKEQLWLTVVVNSAVETSRPLLEEMGHELTVTLPEQPIMVEADLTRLAQVFLNLLNNAAKYSDRGGHIWLTAKQAGSDVLVSVRDTGIGIPGDQLPRIFDLFSQVDRSSKRSQGGLGIGLSLVKRLVEMHGGSIEARSEGPGKGSEFVVRLPVVVEASRPQAEDRQVPAARKSSMRILIVDDNRDAADSLAMVLQQMMGNETRTAYDGQAGIDVAEEFRPDVVLLDIGLPKLNGHEACRRIRGQPWGEGIVLIALTGWGQEEDHRRSREAGFDHHMVKPVDLDALVTLLAELEPTMT